MNTKSFVSGLNPENTVKGYYDENDQLVMVEPEGSGGSGNLGGKKTLNITINVNGSNGVDIVILADSDIYEEASYLIMPDVYMLSHFFNENVERVYNTYTNSYLVSSGNIYDADNVEIPHTFEYLDLKYYSISEMPNNIIVR